MQNTYETLKRHLSNAIYIENGFGLDLFRKKVEQPVHGQVVLSRSSRSVVVNNIEDIPEERTLKVEDFFKASQNFSNEINILPYLFQPEILDAKIEEFRLKLSNFPLIIIDWQLEDGDGGKNGLDVFDKIIDNNEVLHYYVIYSKEISAAVDAFAKKYNTKKGQIAKNNIAVINENAIVLFCDKVTYSINDIIDQLCKFTEENYGFLPQMFLRVKHQIEDRSAVLYNQFMGLDSMMLPQLITDEVYNYEGLQEEVLISVIFNQLRNSVKIENEGNSYLKSVLDKLLDKEFVQDDFDRAGKIVKKISDKLTFEKFKSIIENIKKSQILKSVDFESLKEAAQQFYGYSFSDMDDDKIQDKIQRFILFLSICGDKNFYEKYIKLLSIIKLTEYVANQQWTFKECLNGGKIKGLCQGDVFIDDTDSFLLCITPSCQLMRPKKIYNTYTFLKGSFAKDEGDIKQKQIYPMHLVNKDKTKIYLVKWQFYSPVVLDFSKAENLVNFDKYKRYYRLNMEYTHRIIELYSEFIKQIGVEEIFGKRFKSAFVELKREEE